jgi:septal ring factor EnvC (AmiA/AmiB activator)
MSKRGLLVWASFVFCLSVFPQEPLPTLDAGSGTPSKQLWQVIASLEALEQSEMLTLRDLTSLREDLSRLETSLATSEAMLSKLRMQVDDALQRYETLYRRYEKQQKQLNGWRAACFGSSGATVILIILLIVLL